jgi:limonene-1,2-epoxide hydrolase
MNLSRARLAVVILALGAAACAGANKESANPIRDHDEALAATDPRALGAPAPGSPEEKAAVDRFETFIADLSTATIKARIRDVYAPTLYFNDTLKTIRGVDALETYFLSSDEGMSAYGLKVEQTISTPEGVFVRWRMDVTFRRFHKGEVQSSIGVSHIRFDKDGRVVYHQDYWDSGTNLYEKIPVLGGMIRWVKSRL